MNMPAHPSLPARHPRGSLPALLLLMGILIAVALFVDFAFNESVTARSNGGRFSAPALFNQANADARAGKTGLAIVNYERARLLAPGDPNIAANLLLVRQQAGLPSHTPGWLERAVSWGSPNFWAALGSAGLILAGCGMLVARSIPQGRSFGRLAAVAGCALLVFCGASVIVSWQAGTEAVVTAATAPARISPTTMGEIAFKLRDGQTAKMAGRHGDFVLIRDAAGHAGWVSRSDLTPILPE
jgi:hypothetical protein